MEQKKLKILYFVDNFYPVTGGINTVIDSSCRELIKYADVTVVACKHKTYKDPPRPYTVLRCPGYYNCITNDGMAHPTKKFTKQLIDGKYDIIHCHTAGNLFKYARKLGKKLQIPVVSTIHNTYKQEAKSYVKSEFLANLITKIFFKITDKSDYLFSVSQFCLDNAKKYGLKKDATLLYNAINFAPITDDKIEEGREFINKLHNIDSTVFVASFISRIIKSKNVDLIINTTKLLKEKYPYTTDMKIMIVGDGKYMKYLKKQANKYQLNDYFIFTGMIKDRELLSKYYMRSDLLLFPSTMDSAGLIQVEGAAYKKATLVVENTAPSEKIINHQNGLISKNDPQSYLGEIMYAYHNPIELKEMGCNALKTLYRGYSDKKIIDEILDNYYRIIEDYKSNKRYF